MPQQNARESMATGHCSRPMCLACDAQNTFGLADTHAMEGMLHDYSLATEMQNAFADWLAQSHSLKIGLSVRVGARRPFHRHTAPASVFGPFLERGGMRAGES